MLDQPSPAFLFFWVIIGIPLMAEQVGDHISLVGRVYLLVMLLHNLVNVCLSLSFMDWKEVEQARGKLFTST